MQTFRFVKGKLLEEFEGDLQEPDNLSSLSVWLFQDHVSGTFFQFVEGWNNSVGQTSNCFDGHLSALAQLTPVFADGCLSISLPGAKEYL